MVNLTRTECGRKHENRHGVLNPAYLSQGVAKTYEWIIWSAMTLCDHLDHIIEGVSFGVCVCFSNDTKVSCEELIADDETQDWIGAPGGFLPTPQKMNHVRKAIQCASSKLGMM